MKISLLSPPLMDFQDGRLMPISMDAVRTCPPYGVYLLAAVLRQQGHDVQIVDLISQGSRDLSNHWRHLATSHLIGIGISSLSWPTAKELVSEIRAVLPQTPIVLGGIHATMFDSWLLSSVDATFVIRGEAEVALPQLCAVLEAGADIRRVPNLTYRSLAGNIVRNPIGPVLDESALARLPIPEYASLPQGVYTGLAIESSRGCPFDCSFCSTVHRKSWRGMSPEAFADRVAQVLPYTFYTQKGLLQIIDDEFTLRTERCIEICNIFERRGMSPKIVFDARANDLNKEPFVAAVQPFAHQFLVGAECGYDAGLKKVGKGSTIARLEKAAELLNKYQLAERADFSFIIGLPWETKSEVLQTVHFAFHLYSTYGVRALLQWYCQIPGSRLWEEQRQKEVLHEAMYDDYGFFRNHYLFRTGISLLPSEVREVHNTITSLQSLSGKNREGMDMFQTSSPIPVLQFFPGTEAPFSASGLAGLREAACSESTPSHKETRQ